MSDPILSAERVASLRAIGCCKCCALPLADSHETLRERVAALEAALEAIERDALDHHAEYSDPPHWYLTVARRAQAALAA